MLCRHCASLLKHTFIDLGFAPPSNAYLKFQNLKFPEKYYPLKVMVCDSCWLVQTEDYTEADDLFNAEYAYFSSTSKFFLKHAEEYSKIVINRFNLNKNNFVIEIASNDGYLLKNFVSRDIPCLGIEPTKSTAIAAENIGIPVLREFFSEKLAQKLVKQGKKADLIIGNNVYAHVPDINDFTYGLKALLNENGVITLEFPHIVKLIQYGQFDTIYHEHFSYLSLYAVLKIFKSVGLRIFDIHELESHGGSLRVFACHQNDSRSNESSVDQMLAKEKDFGIAKIETYLSMQEKANNVKNNLLSFLIEQKKSGRKVVAYGAAAKGNTLLNYAGIKSDLLSIVFDAASSKQGKFMPGSHIPILPPSLIQDSKPDFILILPWNIADEVMAQLDYLRKDGIKFVRAVPAMEIL